MEVTQRGDVQRTHNAGLVVTSTLELVALVFLSIITCFFRQVYTLYRRHGPRRWGQEGLPPSNTSGGHPCCWPLLENAKSASSLTTHLGRD